MNRIKEIRTKANMNQKEFAKIFGIAQNTLSQYETGKREADTGLLLQIADYFHVSTDYLLGKEEPTAAPLPDLTAKDERDIAKKLSETLDTLENADDGLMFDGEPLDDETRELLRASLQNQLEMTKRLAKQKFTPKKYRK